MVPSLIWGSTWYVITFQLGKVDPLISVIYRFLLAGLLMMGYCLLKGSPMKYTAKDHLFMVIQGFFLFGANYWLVYEAEQHIASALMAVAFSTVIFMNTGFGALFLKRKINKKVVLAALAGLAGTVLIFWGELTHMDMSPEVVKGSILAICSVVLASLGNITSARNSQEGIPVIHANAFGMLYGAGLMALVALTMGRPFTLDLSAGYVLSLIYLSVLGSIVAFGTYLTLIGRIGADKAAYALVVIPVIAIVISIVFENYHLSVTAITGIFLILGGNIMALKK